jgi:hypothetical protein
MPNDQLTKPERLRLEALAQAIASAMTVPIISFPEEADKMRKLIERAREFEKFLKEANNALDG